MTHWSHSEKGRNPERSSTCKFSDVTIKTSERVNTILNRQRVLTGIKGVGEILKGRIYMTDLN